MKRKRLLVISLCSLVSITGVFTAARLYAQSSDTNQDVFEAGHTGPPAKKSDDLPILSDTTSAIAPAGQAEEMSMEDMLLAAPMGMSKEERDFDFSHKAPQTIRSWSLNEFRAFVSDPVGKQAFLSQGMNWVAFRRMLKGQIQMSREFLEGKSITAPPAPKRITLADGSQSVDPEFLSDNSAFAPEHVAATFENLKTCRQNIADLCKELETLKNNAVQKGKLQELEEHFNKFEWI